MLRSLAWLFLSQSVEHRYTGLTLRSILRYSTIPITLIVIGLAGCSVITGESKIGDGVVIAIKEPLRSSTAAVALDIAELKRGDLVEILEQANIKTPTRVKEWYKIRTKSTDPLVGWVEARSIIDQAVVDKTEELYEQSQQIPSQGRGRLKVQTRLRIEPGGDVITLLSRGTMVDIAGKARSSYKPETQPVEGGIDETSEEPETRSVLWYQVRLPDSDVLHAGWVGAQQVELDVPEEILHLEGEGRRFTGWVIIDQTKSKSGETKNNYIGLMKHIDIGGPIDFTRLWVLIYSPGDGRYFGAYIKDGLRGTLPVTLEGSSGRRTFSFQELDQRDNPVKVDYEMVRIDSSHLKVTRLSPEIPHNKKQQGRRG